MFIHVPSLCHHQRQSSVLLKAESMGEFCSLHTVNQENELISKRQKEFTI